jgi:hypothetical protein
MTKSITPDILQRIKMLMREDRSWRDISQVLRWDYHSLKAAWRQHINSITDTERKILRKECGKGPSEEFPKWQKVTERLPEVGQKVLICTIDKRIRACFFDPLTEKDTQSPGLAHRKAGDIVWKDPCWFYAEHVTHWMALPDPPQE